MRGLLAEELYEFKLAWDVTLYGSNATTAGLDRRYDRVHTGVSFIKVRSGAGRGGRGRWKGRRADGGGGSYLHSQRKQDRAARWGAARRGREGWRVACFGANPSGIGTVK